MTPGQYLKKCRIDADLTQLELARLIKVRTQSISAWECDKAPIPKYRVNEFHTHLKINRTQLLDLMAAFYREGVAKTVRKQIQPRKN